MPDLLAVQGRLVGRQVGLRHVGLDRMPVVGDVEDDLLTILVRVHAVGAGGEAPGILRECGGTDPQQEGGEEEYAEGFHHQKGWLASSKLYPSSVFTGSLAALT